MITLLAHQGGWDEIGLVAAPIAVLAALLVVADRRAKKLGEARRASDAAAAVTDVAAEQTETGAG